MKGQPGDRVVAVKNIDGKHAFIYGLGTYEGDHPIDDDITGWMAEAIRDADLTNPRIKLDSGKHVYGFECWWTNVAQFTMYVRMGYTLTSVDITEERARAAQEAEEDVRA